MIEAADFVGRWHLSRTIDDLTGQSSGTFEGEAVFAEAQAGRLNYRESGLLRLANGTQFRAERGYVWQFGDAEVAVFFADGRPFHTFDLRSGAATEHLCGEDMYRVAYTFDAWPEWTARWRVRGPRKDYVMTSCYAPQSALVSA